IKYLENNLVFNDDSECFAYYELLPYNYSFLSEDEKIHLHLSITPMLLVNDNLHVHKSHTKIQPLFLHFHHVSISHKEKTESLQSQFHSYQSDHQSIPSPFLHFLPIKPHSLI